MRELVARNDRFEHHLLVVGTAGDMQIEVVTASEPLYFAHKNISDEYALALRTGDPMIDGFPIRTFFSDDDHVDIGRVRHRPGQMVLHPYGMLHWTGRLRPPYTMPPFPGARRTGLSLVLCARHATPPSDTRPLIVSAGLEAEVKPYGHEAIPFLLADVYRERAQTLAIVGNARADLVVEPTPVGGEHGGYAVDLDTTDLFFVPPGAELATTARTLWISADSEVSPPPRSWKEVPAAPWDCFEDAEPLPLPSEIAGIALAEADADVALTIGKTASVPRYWLARMLFRIALHDYRLGYVETYGGFYYDDRSGEHVIGLRDGGSVTIARDALPAIVERMYRCVAPEGYRERLD